MIQGHFQTFTCIHFTWRFYLLLQIKWLAPRNDAQQPLVMEEQGRQEVKA